MPMIARPGQINTTPQTLGLLSAALPSPMGDAVGLLADAAGYAQDPKSLTLGRGLLSLASLAPGIPALSNWTRGDGAADWLLHISDAKNAGSISKHGLKPGKDGYVYLWNSGLDSEAEQIMREARMSRLGASFDEAGNIPDAYFAVNKKALGKRLETDPFTGEMRVKGSIAPSLLQSLVK